MSGISFFLESFNSDLTMAVSAALPAGESPPLPQFNSTATYKVSLSNMREAFLIQSDSRDVNNENGDDIRYFVNWPNNHVLNPSHAFVEDAIALTDASGSIPNNRRLVKHDFIRHIAKDLFDTHLAVDLFDNETEIREDLASKGHDVWTNTINPAIVAVSPGGTHTGSVGYTTNALDSSANLCRVLFRQMMHSQPDRFSNLSGLEKQGSPNYFYMPFAVGDSISFKVVYKPKTGQHTILPSRANANPVVPVADRSYRIKLDIVSTAQNVAVDDSSSHATSFVNAY